MTASAMQMLCFPIYIYISIPAELIEKRYLQDTKAYFFKKISLFTQDNKIWTASPQEALQWGATAGHARQSPLKSDSSAQQYSAGKFSFFWYKDCFFVPLFLPSLPLHTDRSVFTSGTWIHQGCLYTAQVVNMERGSGWGGWACSAIFKCFQVAKPMFGVDETNFLLQKTFFACFAHLNKKASDQAVRALPRVLPCWGIGNPRWTVFSSGM